MKKFIFVMLFLSFCGEAVEPLEEIEPIEIIEESSLTSPTTEFIDVKKLDNQYRNGNKFTLPTFNGNCPHKLDEIIELFNYWKKEFNLTISFDVMGEPVFGSASTLQLENCIDKIIGSNLDQNIELSGNEHIEIIVGRQFDKNFITSNELKIDVTEYINLNTYGPITYAVHPTDKKKDVIADITGNIFLASNKNLLLKVDNVTVKDNGGFLALKYLEKDDYLIGFYTSEQSIYIDLFQLNNLQLKKIKTLKEYSFPEYSKCNKSNLLVKIFTHCEENGEESTYIGHAGGGVQIQDGKIYIGLGDTNIASSVFNSIYTTRDEDLPWGSILKFEFDYNQLILNGIGNHKDSKLKEVWIKGVRNPYRFSINAGSIWIADLGTSIEDEVNTVSLNQNNIDLGWPYFEGEFSHQPFFSFNENEIKHKLPIYSERIGGLIGGHFLQVNGKNLYTFGTLNGDIFGLELSEDGLTKYSFNFDQKPIEEGSFLLSIEKSQNGILLLSSNGKIFEIINN